MTRRSFIRGVATGLCGGAAAVRWLTPEPDFESETIAFRGVEILWDFQRPYLETIITTENNMSAFEEQFGIRMNLRCDNARRNVLIAGIKNQ